MQGPEVPYQSGEDEVVVLGHHAHSHSLWESRASATREKHPRSPHSSPPPGEDWASGQTGTGVGEAGGLGWEVPWRSPLNGENDWLTHSSGFHMGVSNKQSLKRRGVGHTLQRFRAGQGLVVCVFRTPLWAFPTQSNADGISPRRLLKCPDFTQLSSASRLERGVQEPGPTSPTRPRRKV